MTEDQAKEIIQQSQEMYEYYLDEEDKLPPNVIGEISRNQILLVSAGVCTGEEFVNFVRLKRSDRT
jgi:hypothetical protein